MDALLKPSELAKILGISTGHCYRLCSERKLPHLKLGGSLRFDPAAIQIWVQKQRVLSVAEVVRSTGKKKNP